MSKVADSMLIWREGVYKNGFKCLSCGALLFDTAKNAPTEDLAFESLIPDLRLPARCRCGRCGTPAAVAQANTGGMDGWTPVKKRLPEHRVDVLLRFKHNYAVGFYDHEYEFWGINTGDNMFSAIHEEEPIPLEWKSLAGPDD